MNLSDAKTLCELHMENHGLLAKGWTVKFDRAKRRNGICYCFHRQIGLSTVFVSLNDENAVKQTILHEIAHALVGGENGHNWVWKRKAREIGYKGERTSGPNVVRSEGKYKGVCLKCEKVFWLHRMPKEPFARRTHVGCGGEVKFDYGADAGRAVAQQHKAEITPWRPRRKSRRFVRRHAPS